jgi:hypothetical protein
VPSKTALVPFLSPFRLLCFVPIESKAKQKWFVCLLYLLDDKPEFEEEEHNCTNESKDASIGIAVKVNFEVLVPERKRDEKESLLKSYNEILWFRLS